MEKYRKFLIGCLAFLFVLFMNFNAELYFPSENLFIYAILSSLIMAISYQIYKIYHYLNYPRKYKLILLIIVFVLLVIVRVYMEWYFDRIVHAANIRGITVQRELIKSMFLAFTLIGFPMIFSWALLLADQNRNNEIAIAKLKGLNREAELSELKNQLNPHFLFNALSNIYSIAYLGDKQTPDKIMQLSKMLRYVIYETDVDFIALEREVCYLNYYIDFQKFKIAKEQKIEFDYKDCDQNVRIAPLILLPFLENSFKHSHIASEKDAWIKMQLKTENNTIFLKIENTISEKENMEILNNSGIGLDNIKKRLELIYKDNYILKVETKETFQVSLIILTND